LILTACHRVKLIQLPPSATQEMKAEVRKIYEEADKADREILR
jgi:hypothetical protein